MSDLPSLTAASQQASMPLTPLNLLTPSETVLLNGSQFASKTIFGNTMLLDAKTRVYSRDLVVAELKAALLAHEQMGTIRLEVSKANGADPSLYVQPTGRQVSWPLPSLESRLQFIGYQEVSEVVRRWLCEDVTKPWKRAAEKTFIPLVLRGIADVKQGLSTKSYRLINADAALVASEGLQAIVDLFAECQRNRPEVWKLLETGITGAMEESEVRANEADDTEQEEAEDPWDDEAQADAKRAFEPINKETEIKLTWTLVFVIGGIAWAALLLAAVFVSSSVKVILVGSAVGCAVCQLFYRLYKAAAAKYDVDAGPGSASQPSELEIELERTLRVILAPPVAALFIWALSMITRRDPSELLFAIIGVVVIAIIAVGSYLKRKASQAITTRIQRSTEVSPSARAMKNTAAGQALTGSPQLIHAAQPPLPPSITTPRDVPPISKASGLRLKMIRMRGLRIRQLYRHAVGFLALGSMLLAVCGKFLVPNSFSNITTALFVITMLILFLPRSAKRSWMKGVKRGRMALDLTMFIGRHIDKLRGNNRWWASDVTPIQPDAGPLLEVFWFLLVFRYLIKWSSGVTPWRWILIVVTLTALILYIVKFQQKRAQLEKLYPVYPPLNLLALRVFCSPNLEAFMNLIDLWRWLGPIQQLDGPDTAGGKVADVVAYLTGHLDKRIVKSEEELERTLTSFASTFDSQLRYSLNSVQCNDATWKDALQRLVEKADVVVMDLGGFTAKNRGCSYEIGKLSTQLSFERFILLVDDATDLAALKASLAEVEAETGGVCEPTRAAASQRKFRLLALSTQRKDNESVHEWQQRAVVEPEQLVGLLCDAALTKHGDERPQAVHWARPRFWLRGHPYS